MFRLIVLNAKGGCGKTTLSVNLASYFSQQGRVTTLMDLDPQGSSVHWAHCRPETEAEVQLVDAHNCSPSVTRSWAIQPPRNTEVLVIDTPARPNLHTINPLLVDASAILIPVQPSAFDMHTATDFIEQLKHNITGLGNLAIVANRARKSSERYKNLLQFFADHKLPVVATLRDSENFAITNAQGLGITETKANNMSRDRDSFLQLAHWCEAQMKQQESGAQACRKTIPPSHFMALGGIA